MTSPFDMGGLGAMLGGFQQNVAAMKERQANTIYEGSAGGDLVRVKVAGDNSVVSVHIDPKAAEDTELLEDLVRAATNEALRQVREGLAAELATLTGGLPIPPGMIPGL